ncbi:MAG: putative transposase [Caballeronia sp.]|jgi:transposase-like protein|nr:putative transposase [Caballeronia sp.]
MVKTRNAAVSKALKRLHYPLDIMLTRVRWYVAYPMSLRHLEEMMSERAVSVDHSTVHRWAIKLLPPGLFATTIRAPVSIEQRRRVMCGGKLGCRG